jgi:hypothetical protein
MKDGPVARYRVEGVGDFALPQVRMVIKNGTLEEARRLVRELLAVKLEEKPRFSHDCDRCIFLGRYDKGEKVDLYFCSQSTLAGSKWPTVIARFSNKSSDYVSGLPLTNQSQPLDAAKRRAEERGLLPIAESNDREVYGLPCLRLVTITELRDDEK